MKKITVLFILLALLLSGCQSEKVSEETKTDSYLVMEQSVSSRKLLLKVWLRGDLTPENITDFGKELSNANKSLYESVKVEFYKIKEEIALPYTTPEAISIWGPRGYFENTEDVSDNMFVTEIRTQHITFSEEETEIYSEYLRLTTEKEPYDSLLSKYGITEDELTLLVHRFSSRFIEL